MTIQASQQPFRAVGAGRLQLAAGWTGNGAGAPTADARNREVTLARVSKGLFRATVSAYGSVNPLQLDVHVLSALQLGGRVKSVSAANRTVDVEIFSRNVPPNQVQPKAADAAASTATAETVLAIVPAAATVTGVRFVPIAAVTADNTNNAVITVSKRTAAGASKTTVATLTTNVAGGSWTAWVAKAATLSGTPANLEVEANAVLSIEITKGGTGVQLPAMLMVVEYSDLIDPTSSDRVFLEATYLV